MNKIGYLPLGIAASAILSLGTAAAQIVPSASGQIVPSAMQIVPAPIDLLAAFETEEDGDAL